MSDSVIDRSPLGERPIRNHPLCCGCGGPKDRGLLVCWPCFKYCTAPYKYAGGSLVAWVAAGGPVEWLPDWTDRGVPLNEARPIHPQPELLAKLAEGGAA